MGSAVSHSTFDRAVRSESGAGDSIVRQLQVYAVSDMHTEHQRNWDMVQEWPEWLRRHEESGDTNEEIDRAGGETDGVVGPRETHEADEDQLAERGGGARERPGRVGESDGGVGGTSSSSAPEEHSLRSVGDGAHRSGVAERRGQVVERALICAGDIATDLSVLRATLRALAAMFEHVLFVPGNNELRLTRRERQRSESKSSLDKLQEVMRICEEEGIHTGPFERCGVVFLPLLAWYTPTFDGTWGGDVSYRRGWLDFRACKWPAAWTEPSNPDSICEHFAALNGPAIHDMSLSLSEESSRALDGSAVNDEKFIITYSHFLPRRDLLPMPAVWMKPTLPLVVGDPRIEDQLRTAKSRLHVYGHTHINGDTVHSGVRYVQHALGHPGERPAGPLSFKECRKPKLVHVATFEHA